MRSTSHINPIAPIASTIFLPRDPLCAKFTAKTYLEDAQRFNAVRNMLDYAGTYRGTPVSVMGSGTDILLISLYTHELTHGFGRMRLVRVGTCGALQSDVSLYDVMIAQAACSNSALLDQYRIPGSYAPIGSFHPIDDVVRRVREADVSIRVGDIFSSDTFYNANPTFNETWQRIGTLVAEIESAGPYATIAHMDVEAVGVFTISDSLITGGATGAQAHQTSPTTMMGLALSLAQL